MLVLEGEWGTGYTGTVVGEYMGMSRDDYRHPLPQ